jgi:hypothetical protein
MSDSEHVPSAAVPADPPMSRSEKIQEKRKKHQRASTLLAESAAASGPEQPVDLPVPEQVAAAAAAAAQAQIEQPPQEPLFVPAAVFSCRKEGWYFTTGVWGLGYYQDVPEMRVQNATVGIVFENDMDSEDMESDYDEEADPFVLSTGGDEQQMHANMKLKMAGETVERVMRNNSLLQTEEFVELIVMYHESLEHSLVLHDPSDRLPLAIHTIESLEQLLPEHDLGLIPFVSALGHSYLLLDDLEEALRCTLRCVVMLVRVEGQCPAAMLKPFVILLYSLSNWFVLQAMEAEDYLSVGTSENFTDVQAVVETSDLSITALESDDVRAIFATIDSGESLQDLDGFDDSGKVAFSCFSCSWHMYIVQSRCIGIEGGWSGLSGPTSALTSAWKHACQATKTDNFSAIARAYRALARMAQATTSKRHELDEKASSHTDLQQPRPSIYSEHLINQFCEDCAKSEELGLGDTGVEMSGFHARVQRYMRAWGMQMALTEIMVCHP